MHGLEHDVDLYRDSEHLSLVDISFVMDEAKLVDSSGLIRFNF